MRAWQAEKPAPRGLFDPAAAQDQVAVIKDSALAGSDGTLRLVEDDLDPRLRKRVRSVQSGKSAGVLMADLHQGTHRIGNSCDRNPVDVLREKASAQELVVSA